MVKNVLDWLGLRRHVTPVSVRVDVDVSRVTFLEGRFVLQIAYFQIYRIFFPHIIHYFLLNRYIIVVKTVDK